MGLHETAGNCSGDYGECIKVLKRHFTRERLALNQYLSQFEDPRLAFGVKQKRPCHIEEAVAAAIELKSYLNTCSKSHRHIVVPQQQ